MRAQIDEQSVIKANSQFWEQMLAMTLHPLDEPAEFCLDAGHMLGSVSLSGVWSGTIEVRLNDRLAYHATAAMLMQNVETVGETDALDAAKEIANMIAGTIKSSLPRPCEMSLPESTVQTERFCSESQTEASMVVAFRHSAGDMLVRIVEQECL